MLIGEVSRDKYAGGRAGPAILGTKEYLFTFVVKNKMLRARNGAEARYPFLRKWLF
jgi:hypothetical protein